MPNPSPHKARMAKKRRGKPGNLTATQAVLWRAIQAAETILTDAMDEADRQLRAVHAISQACGQYAKLLEVGELEARLAALETDLRSLRAPQPSRYTT
jgi:hypothetical protein